MPRLCPRWRNKFLILCLLVTPIILFGGQIAHEARQQQLNHALVEAVKRDNTVLALDCLARGADANARDEALDARGFWQRLLDRLRGKSMTPARGPSALLLALDFRPAGEERLYAPENFKLIAALMDHGANANVKNNQGMPALVLAAWSQRAETLRCMLARGANPELATDNGLTALHLAAEHERVDLMTVLLDGGANINAQDAEGMTPLLWSVHDGNDAHDQARAVAYLLSRHANLTLAAKNGDTPLAFARTRNHLAAQLIRQAGAKR